MKDKARQKCVCSLLFVCLAVCPGTLLWGLSAPAGRSFGEDVPKWPAQSFCLHRVCCFGLNSFKLD